MLSIASTRIRTGDLLITNQLHYRCAMLATPEKKSWHDQELWASRSELSVGDRRAWIARASRGRSGVGSLMRVGVRRGGGRRMERFLHDTGFARRPRPNMPSGPCGTCGTATPRSSSRNRPGCWGDRGDRLSLAGISENRCCTSPAISSRFLRVPFSLGTFCVNILCGC